MVTDALENTSNHHIHRQSSYRTCIKIQHTLRATRWHRLNYRIISMLSTKTSGAKCVSMVKLKKLWYATTITITWLAMFMQDSNMKKMHKRLAMHWIAGGMLQDLFTVNWVRSQILEKLVVGWTVVKVVWEADSAILYIENNQVLNWIENWNWPRRNGWKTEVEIRGVCQEVQHQNHQEREVEQTLSFEMKSFDGFVFSSDTKQRRINIWHANTCHSLSSSVPLHDCIYGGFKV